MSEETTKTMTEAVKEIKNRKTDTVNVENDDTLLDRFAMAALTGLLSSNSAKDAARKSYILAQEMMEVRKQAVKGKLKD